jgi:anti-anti-sigma regulatory factor
MCEIELVLEESPSHSSCCLRLSGDLNVIHAQTLHQHVLSACEKFPEVVFYFSHVTAFDVSAMQILLSAGKQAATRVAYRTGEGAECIAHWLEIAGLSSAFANQAA